jgi:sugar lactone lactonase YvrE
MRLPRIIFSAFVLLTFSTTFGQESELLKASSSSFYTMPLDDPHAVYLTPVQFDVTPDEEGDDSAALQAAIDTVQKRYRFGIVFIPEGTYQITKTIYVWKGIRLIGYGENRPVFVLEENTPGYDEGEGKYMIHFVSDKPDEGRPIRDANPGTFYSAISNINFHIREGNPAAIAVRSFFAQHSYIAHVDFLIGEGRAGVEKVGNEIDNCRFIGGDYGIITTKPSPSWPFLMIDSYFEGQRKAAISTEEGGLTLVRNHFKNVPHAIVVNPDRAEELFITDSRFENITGSAVVISDEYNARSQYNFINIVCSNVPILAEYRQSGRKVKVDEPLYRVEDFCHGMQIDDLGTDPEIKTTFEWIPLKQLSPPIPSDIPPLPPVQKWVNILELGAKGDGVTDDTDAIQNAIEQFNTLYLPTGRYMVKETIRLKPNTVLIGLHPMTTQLVLADNAPGFKGPGSPKPLLESPQKGENIITGIGLNTGAYNNRAVAAKWMAGENSMMNDVRFVGCHGTYNADGSPVPVYDQFRITNPYHDREWDSEYWSLWITDGGGGTFKNIWTPNSFAQTGIYISYTSTPGRIYAMSVEHHVRNELIINNVSNWKMYAIQFEEESAEGPEALPVRIEDSSNIEFANLYLYRVIRMKTSFPHGVWVNNSRDLRFRGVHLYSPTVYSFDNTVYDNTYNYQIREREIARLTVSGNPPIENNKDTSSSGIVLSKMPEKVAGGFEWIAGLTSDAEGNVYFTDSRKKQIFRYSGENNELKLIADLPFEPSALVFDQSGNLLVSTRRGELVVFNPDSGVVDLSPLPEVTADSHNGRIVVLPGHLWRDEHDFLDITTYSETKPPVTYSSYQRYFREQSNPLENHFIAPDGITFIPHFSDLRRTVSLKRAVPDTHYYMADEFGQKTYRFSVQPNGSLKNPELVAERGELDVAADVEGNVYIPAGNVYVYNSKGEMIDVIKVPERPSCVTFGDSDNKTLYIAARTSLYKIRVKYPGHVITID